MLVVKCPENREEEFFARDFFVEKTGPFGVRFQDNQATIHCRLQKALTWSLTMAVEDLQIIFITKSAERSLLPHKRDPNTASAFREDLIKLHQASVDLDFVGLTNVRVETIDDRIQGHINHMRAKQTFIVRGNEVCAYGFMCDLLSKFITFATEFFDNLTDRLAIMKRKFDEFSLERNTLIDEVAFRHHITVAKNCFDAMKRCGSFYHVYVVSRAFGVHLSESQRNIVEAKEKLVTLVGLDTLYPNVRFLVGPTISLTLDGVKTSTSYHTFFLKSRPYFQHLYKRTVTEVDFDKGELRFLLDPCKLDQNQQSFHPTGELVRVAHAMLPTYTFEPPFEKLPFSRAMPDHLKYRQPRLTKPLFRKRDVEVVVGLKR